MTNWGEQSQAWQHYRISTTEQGGAVVHVETNDDNDDGWDDGTVEQWSLRFDTVEQALKRTGRSRVGISGVRVTVWLDGEEVR